MAGSVRPGSLKLFSREAHSFLQTAMVCQLAGDQTQIPEDPGLDQLIADRAPRLVLGERMACSTCQVEFSERQQQVHHFKLDWHRYNIKQKIVGKATVTEEDFEEMSDVSSISGSDTETKDTSESNCSSQFNAMCLSSRLPKVYVTGDDNLLYSMYKCVVPNQKAEKSFSMTQLSAVVANPMWVIIMLSGGHFAGATFQGNDIVAHKTFHRYTVRAKSGTAQSVRDAQGSQPKSAGASLRRYNEAALQQDIRTVIESWAVYLDQASAIFMRAPGENRKMFFSGKTPLLSKDDSRVSSIPFATRRPTLKEVERVHNILSTVQCHGTRKEFLQAQEEQSLIRSGKRKHFTDKKLQSEKRILKTERGPEDVGAAVLYRRDLLVPSINLDIGVEERPRGDRARCVTDGSKSTEMVEEKTLMKERDDEKETLIEGKASKAEESVKEPSLEDKLFSACKMGDLVSAEQLLTDILQHQCIETEGEDQRCGSDHAVLDRPLEKESDTTVVTGDKVRSDGDLTVLGDETRRLNVCVNQDGETFLHAAAQGGHPVVISLLLFHGADPSVKDKRGRPPYAVAREKPARNAFRRFMASHPNRFDYIAAQVPSALTDELEREQERKKLVKKKAQRKVKKQKDKEEKEVTRKLQAEEEEKRKWDAMSERERRALAAEKRLAQQLQEKAARGKTSGECSWCYYGLDGVTPFHKFSYKYCSLDCLKSHREELQSH